LRDEWLNPSDEELIRGGGKLKDRTLTNLYNKRPDWLDQAHKQLDAAVFDAYGWPHDLSDDEILARLLALNLERAAAAPSYAAEATSQGVSLPATHLISHRVPRLAECNSGARLGWCRRAF